MNKKNIFNNYLIDASYHTSDLFFQKLPCHHFIPIPDPIFVVVHVLPGVA